MRKLINGLSRANQYLGVIESWILIVMVAAMTVVVFLQVCFRYFLAQPLYWSEELARYLFVWISMIGASLSIQKGGHFGMDFFFRKFPDRSRSYIGYVVYLLMMGGCPSDPDPGDRPCATHLRPDFSSDRDVNGAGVCLDSSGGGPDGDPSAGDPVKGAPEDKVRRICGETFGRPGLFTSSERQTMGAFLSIIFLFFIAFNVPIAFSMALSSIFGILLNGTMPLLIVPQKIFNGCDSFSMLAVPLFILAGGLMDTGGISLRLVNLANALVGHFRNGLGMVSIISEIFFSGISGSTAADTAAIGSIMIPAMNQAGYTPARATAIVCAACGMGILVPPCIAMVIYGGTANASVAALFAGGFLPAFLMAAALMIQLNIQARREGVLPGRFAGTKTLIRTFKEAILALFMPIIIFGGILGGICTPTEAAVLAVFYGLIISMFVYREITVKSLVALLLNTGMVTGQVMIMVGMASIFGWILTREQVPQALASLIYSIGGGKVLFLMLINIAFLFLGAILEGAPALIMTVPILLPIATQFGVDPIHFGIILIANMGVGLFLPPIGVGVFIGCSVGKITISEVARPLIPYLMVNFATVLLITYWPGLTMAVPNLFFGSIRP